VPEESTFQKVAELDGLRVATAYPVHDQGCARASRGDGRARACSLGSVRRAPRLGLSDAVVDLVSTGSDRGGQRTGAESASWRVAGPVLIRQQARSRRAHRDASSGWSMMLLRVVNRCPPPPLFDAECTGGEVAELEALLPSIGGALGRRAGQAGTAGVARAVDVEEILGSAA